MSRSGLAWLTGVLLSAGLSVVALAGLATGIPLLVVSLLLALAACLGLGGLVLLILPPIESAFLRIALAVFFGWGLIGLGLSFLGFGAMLDPIAVFSLWGLFAPAAIPFLLGIYSGRQRGKRFWPTSVWLGLMLLVLFATLGAQTSARPPLSEESWVHQAALARQWALSGEVWARVGVHPSFAPSLPLVWRAAGTVAAGDLGESWFGWVELLLACFGVAACVRAVLLKGWAAAVLASTFFLAIPAPAFLTAERSTGVAATGFALAGLWAILRAVHPEETATSRAWTGVAGLLTGFALSCGWQAWPIAVAVLVTSTFAPSTEGNTTPVSRMGLIGFLSLVPLTPWLARAAFLTGNPLYPHLFGGTGWDEIAANGAAPLAAGLPDLLGWVIGTPQSPLTIGPLLLLLLPLACAAPALGERATPLAIAGGVLVAGWVVQGMPAGWAVPALGLLVALGGSSAARVRRQMPGPGKVVLAMLLTTSLLQIVPWWQALEIAEFGFGPNALELLERRAPDAIYLGEATLELPADANVLLIGETRAWFAARPAIWASPREIAPVTLLLRETNLRGAADPALAFRAILRHREISHFLVSPQQAWKLESAGHFREQGEQQWTVIFRYMADPRQTWGDPATGNALWTEGPGLAPALENGGS